MTRQVRFTIPATLPNVGSIAESLKSFMEGHLPEETCHAIEIGVVEALTNIVSHGYKHNGEAVIELSFSHSESSALVEITDRGTPIPHEELERNTAEVFSFDENDIANLPVGGMGLSLIKQVFDAVRYETEQGANRLTMAKRFGEDPQDQPVSDNQT
jgi:serine/threonine-protein kinase RsbW